MQQQLFLHIRKPNLAGFRHWGLSAEMIFSSLLYLVLFSSNFPLLEQKNPLTPYLPDNEESAACRFLVSTMHRSRKEAGVEGTHTPTSRLSPILKGDSNKL